MTTTINADTVVGGAVITGDISGELGLQAAGSTKLTVTAAGVSLATPLPIASGGTGSSSTTFANLTTNVTGTLPIANGGTGTTSTTFANLATNVTGTLPIANGGTGTTSTTFADLTTNVTGTLPIANGGTGRTSLTSNNVILGNGTSAVNFVAPGTNGNVLTSNGTTWQSTAPAGGGSWIFITSVTASGASTVDVESSFDSTYDQYVIVAPAFTLSGNPQFTELRMQLKIGGSYPSSSGYLYVSNQSNSTTYSALSSTNNDAIYLTSRLSDSVTYPNAVMDLIIYISKPYTTNRNKSVMWQGTQTFQSAPNVMTGVGWYSGSTAALTGVRLLFASGATFSGNFRLYGIKNS